MRILFLSSWFPYPPINGAKIRIYNLVRELAKNHQLTLLAFARSMPIEEACSYVPVLEKYCRSVDVIAERRFTPYEMAAVRGLFSTSPRSVVATHNPEMERLLRSRLAEGTFDVVVASEVGPPAAMARFASRVRGLPKVLDALEIGLARSAYYDEKNALCRLRRRMTWMKQQSFTRKVLNQSDACTVPSIQEKQYLSPLAGEDTTIEVIPHSLDLAHYAGINPAPSPLSIVYTGSFTYYPNADGVMYFLEQIFPLIKASVPGVQMRIVGSTGDVDLGQLPVDDSVHFTGLVKDVRSIVSQSWLSVVPLRTGAGTRLKIIESMALGTPVVSTSKGAEGLDVTHGKDILIADRPQEFAHAVLGLIRDQNLRQRLSEQGRKTISKRYSATAMGRDLDSLLQRVVHKS